MHLSMPPTLPIPCAGHLHQVLQEFFQLNNLLVFGHIGGQVAFLKQLDPAGQLYDLPRHVLPNIG
jgi:hypothetical protein